MYQSEPVLKLWQSAGWLANPSWAGNTMPKKDFLRKMAFYETNIWILFIPGWYIYGMKYSFMQHLTSKLEEQKVS